MANVTGEAAREVSSYMTAIWNNFDDGSKKLEYYTDVMTALGAATAASTDEIATGLEKFAGIAETVGLSYEYATAAVTTLVDKTRQSPETIGTAMKTIFSRLQGLKLGETLDDGTSLNKYSEALATVGVNIKDQYGSLKKMD
jgi:TP901 family phage tail tape measure protein